MGGWGTFLDRVTSWLPFQGRIEAIKNKIDKLEKERHEILSNPATDVSAMRIIAIDRELDKLRVALKNKAKD